MGPVKLSVIVEEIDIKMDESEKFIDTTTGSIITINHEDLSIAEKFLEGDDISDYPKWQIESAKKALNILEEPSIGRYMKLPDKYEIDEYSIMERFASSVDDEKIETILYSSLNSKGAYRRFKGTVRTLGLEGEWHAFRNEAIKRTVIRWCEYHDIEYQDQ